MQYLTFYVSRSSYYKSRVDIEMNSCWFYILKHTVSCTVLHIIRKYIHLLRKKTISCKFNIKHVWNIKQN